MQKLGLPILLLTFAISSWDAAADTFNPSHSCSKPYKPYEFEDEWEVRRFEDEVEEYKQCLMDFVDEQNEEIRNHEDAAEEAIEEWNNYVNYEL